jgi:ubiquinone biosynthesis monooxygenase Coq7
MIRVDQAGELGAAEIYRGQLAVLKDRPCAAVLQDMAAQEDAHLAAFDKLIVERGVRPSALSPVWRMAGFALGAGSALLGERAAMATTVAVEEVIEGHYQKQLDELGPDEAELRGVIAEFREDELKHRDMALENGAEDAPAYQILSQSVKAGTRLAIWLAERI